MLQKIEVLMAVQVSNNRNIASDDQNEKKRLEG